METDVHLRWSVHAKEMSSVAREDDLIELYNIKLIKNIDKRHNPTGKVFFELKFKLPAKLKVAQKRPRGFTSFSVLKTNNAV